jgi:nitrogenase molybdenum-iron protein alpha/beta subunit
MEGRNEALKALDKISVELMEGPKRTLPAIGYEIASAVRELSTDEEVENRASDAARALRSVNSEAQKKAARENGKKGGRPRKKKD